MDMKRSDSVTGGKRASMTNLLPSWSYKDRKSSPWSILHAYSFRTSRILQLLIALVTILVISTRWRPEATNMNGTSSLQRALSLPRSIQLPFTRQSKRLGEFIVRPQDWKERVTLIAVYGGSSYATYLPMLFQTAIQNQRSLDLLFVNIDQGQGCLDLSDFTDPKSPNHGRNLKHLCVNEVENDKLYAKFVCKGYEKGCSTQDDSIIMNHLEGLRNFTKAINDEIYNTFKPWRGLVYKEHINTQWWGWFDADQLIGNFDHLLPKDIMNNFDMILPTLTSPSPKSLFLPGQLVLFKNNKKMEMVPYRYKPLSGIEHFQLLRPGSHNPGLDEGSYSDLYINKLPEVDIVRIPDIQGGEPLYGDRRIIVADGHLLSAYRHVTRDDIQMWFNRLHDTKFRAYRVGNTFSEYGRTFKMNVSHAADLWCCENAWNPINTCPDWTPGSSRQIVYRKNGGDWMVRREPKIAPHHEVWPAALEARMYAHFLVTKREVAHWKMPNMIESGFRKERINANFLPGEGLKVKGREITVFEMSQDWWGTWTLTTGDVDPPRGFETTHRLKDIAEGNDYYWKYHQGTSEMQTFPMGPAPPNLKPWGLTAEVVPAKP